MLAERDIPDTANPVDAAMAWHGGDARAAIVALLQARIHLQRELRDGKSLHEQGLYARLDAGTRIRTVMKFMTPNSIPDFTIEPREGSKRSRAAASGRSSKSHLPGDSDCA